MMAATMRPHRRPKRPVCCTPRLAGAVGLADFAVAITMGMITSPGPLQLIVPDVQSIGAGDYPGVLTPAFVVPSSILLHVLSLRQLRRRSRAEVARR